MADQAAIPLVHGDSSGAAPREVRYCDEIIRPPRDDMRGKTKAMTYHSINPYDGMLLQTFEEFTGEQLETELPTAETCFQAWRHTRVGAS